MRRIPRAVAIPALLVGAVGAVAASLFVGPVPLGHEKIGPILLELRLPRALLAFVVGASLGASVVVFQGLFRNPLADPFVVGVSGGAALGAVAAVVLGLEATLLGLGSATVAAFAGALGAAFLAYQLARVRGRVPVGSLLLSGFAIGSFAGALVSILLLFNSKNWNEVIAWLFGNLNHPDPWTRVKVVLPFATASTAVMAIYSRDLDLMLLGEESAQQLGVEVERVKRVLLGAGAVAAAAAVAVCGIIGFVGLIVPHVVRGLVGPRHRMLLPVTVLAGGTLLTLADVAARAASADSPLPIGAVTALFGAPFFVYLLRRRAVRV
jgi:iron complex transport system permease protein